MPNALDPPPNTPIDFDFPCAACHYNLRTRLPSDRCPECSTPIADSFAHHKNLSRILFNPARAIVALRFMAAGLLVETLAAAVTYAPFYVTGDPVGEMIISFFMLCGYCVVTAAVISFVTAIRPSLRIPPGAPWRILTIALRLLNFGLVVTSHYLEISFSINLSLYKTRPTIAYWLFDHASISLIEAIGIVLNILCFAYAIRLCKALRKTRLLITAISLLIFFILIQNVLLATHIINMLNYAFPHPLVNPATLISIRRPMRIAALALDLVDAIGMLVLAAALRRVDHNEPPAPPQLIP